MGTFYGVVGHIQKTRQNLLLMSSDNQNILRVLKMVEMPQLFINQNTVYDIYCMEKITKLRKDIDRTRVDLDEFNTTPIAIKFIRWEEGEDSAIKLHVYEEHCLNMLILHEVRGFTLELVLISETSIVIIRDGE
jgi:hypothetical protein